MGGEDNEGEQCDDKSHTVGYQQRNREVDIGGRALGGKVIQCAGADRQDNGEVEEEHGGDSSTLNRHFQIRRRYFTGGVNRFGNQDRVDGGEEVLQKHFLKM